MPAARTVSWIVFFRQPSSTSCAAGDAMGSEHVEAAPLVRSSYHAADSLRSGAIC